jgi:hypothetical protein
MYISSLQLSDNQTTPNKIINKQYNEMVVIVGTLVAL